MFLIDCRSSGVYLQVQTVLIWQIAHQWEQNVALKKTILKESSIFQIEYLIMAHRNAAERKSVFSQSYTSFKTFQSNLYGVSNTLSNFNNSLRANQLLISWTAFDERLINKNQTSNMSHFASGLILGKSCVAGEGLMLFCYFGLQS